MASDMARLIMREYLEQKEEDVRKRSDTFEISVLKTLPDGTKTKVVAHAIEFGFVPPATTRVVIIFHASKSSKPLYLDRAAPGERITPVVRSCVHVVCSAAKATVERLKRESESGGLPPPDVDVLASWGMLGTMVLPFDASAYAFENNTRDMEKTVMQMMDACNSLIWI